MEAGALVIGSSHAAAAILAATLAAFVLLARAQARANRLLAGLLVAEAVFQAAMAVVSFAPTSDNAPPAPGSPLLFVFPVAIVAIFSASALYLVFLGSLDTPLARPFRRPLFARCLLALAVLVALLAAIVSTMSYRGESPLADTLGGVMFVATILLMTLASFYGFAACVSAWRRARAGTESRRRALAFVLAFGGRDALFLAHIVGGPVLGNVAPIPDVARVILQAFLGLATVVFAAFLAYGFLRTQLFDLDLRIKWTISRGTVAGIILVAVFVVAKLVESYLNSTVGFVAGSIVAGALLFVVPKLNKIGDKVANTALPSVQPTSDYIAYKKLEVYRAAIESAQETGGIQLKERAMLERLRAKLGLSEADARALEAELAGGN